MFSSCSLRGLRLRLKFSLCFLFVFVTVTVTIIRHAWCYNHNRVCGIQALVALLHIAGTTCKAYSSLGKCDGEHALSYAHFVIWCCMRLLLEEPILLLENVPEFPAETLKSMLPMYEWSNVVLTPDMLGQPIRRDRIYIAIGPQLVLLKAIVEPFSGLVSLFVFKFPSLAA